MTKRERELIEKIKQEMPEFTGTRVEIEKKIAMFIYLYLGKRKVFDEQYFLGNRKEKDKIIKYNKKIKLDEIIEKRRVVCYTLSRLYKRLLDIFKIDAYNIKTSDEKDNHICNKINLSDGTSLIVDLQRDLPNIQTHSKTKYFGTEKEYGQETSECLNDEEIYNLELECGYIKDEQEYMDKRIDELKEKIQDLPPDELLQRVIEDQEINNYQKDIGYIELFSYYSALLNIINPIYNKKDINYFNCFVKKTDEKGKEYKEYTMCIYSIYKNEAKAYLYSNKDKKFMPTSLEKLDELEKNGFYLGSNPDENGVRLLRKYITEKTYNIKYKNRNGEKIC
ncbi:MAG: hypothetical protein IKF97_02215 [Clostridia bacterium]|nr:hypothetical protein [Clostridia bacterium]